MKTCNPCTCEEAGAFKGVLSCVRLPFPEFKRPRQEGTASSRHVRRLYIYSRTCKKKKKKVVFKLGMMSLVPRLRQKQDDYKKFPQILS